MRRPAFTSAVAVTVAPAQPSSPHAIVSESDCDSDLEYNPAAVESEVSSTDDDEEPSVDILCGARRHCRENLAAQLQRLWTVKHHQFAGFQLQKAASPAASLPETGAGRQAPVANKRKTRKPSVSASAEATAVAPTSTEALATEGTIEASNS